MTYYGNRYHILISMICSLLSTLLIGYIEYERYRNLYFTIDMEVSSVGVAQLFIDKGRGYTESDSERLRVWPGGFHSYSFSLGISEFKSLRFDPTNNEATIKIKSARIENGEGIVLKRFLLRWFNPGLQIEPMELKEDLVTIRTTDHANDPTLILEDSSINPNLLDKGLGLVPFLTTNGWKLAGYAFLFSIVFVAVAILYRLNAAIFIKALAITYSDRHPIIAIVLIGLVTTIASCYPVVFFGKTFVHPVGLAALYDRPPWIPGLAVNALTENFHHSDVAATAWSIAPNSVVQYDAIFRFHEFPFWSRYVGGGIDLFGQGQSMIGDVLHWIPVVFSGSAIAWDIKYLLSRALFVIGIGLLVVRLTDSLTAGALITISSSFLGLYAFRFNHPASFVLTYTPYVILQWDRFGKVLVSPDSGFKGTLLQGLLLATITWLQLNAGLPKEGVITACFVHSLGAFLFYGNISRTYKVLPSLGLLWLLGISFAMITAPYWLLFLDTLGKSVTVYDVPRVTTIPFWALIGFFDNAFYLERFQHVTAPSLNLFLFFCISASLVVSIRLPNSRIVYACWGLFTLALSVAFGIIPDSILLSVPFVNKVHHVGDTFSMPMVCIGILIAGYGVSDFIVASRSLRALVVCVSLSTYFALFLLYRISC